MNKAFTDEFLSDLLVVSRGGSGAGVAFILQELTVPPMELPELLERVAIAKQVQGGRPVGSVSAVLGEYFKALEARGADAHEPVRNIKLTAVMVEAPIGEDILRAHGEDVAALDGGAPSGAGDIVSAASVGDVGARAESVSAAWHDAALDSGPETALPLRGGASAAAAAPGAAATAHRYSPSHGAVGGASSAAQEAELLALRDKFNNVAAEVLALNAEKQGLAHAVIKREREFEVRAVCVSFTPHTLLSPPFHRPRLAQDLRQQYATLVQQRDARPLGGDGLRRRGRGSAGVDEDEDDDTTKDHSQVAGFLLWQLILTAVVAFLLGRLTAAGAPAPLLPP